MAEHHDLEDKSVIVTGANGGMRAAICTSLADAGAAVTASDLHGDGGDALAGCNGSVTYRRADVSDPDDVNAGHPRAVRTIRRSRRASP